MDPIQNPFAAGPSMPPTRLVGRDAVLDHARLFFARLQAGKGEQSLILSGLRGSGKSVLLEALSRLPEAQGLELELVDEAQALPPKDLSALIQRQEAHLRAQAPKAVILAGLPLEAQLNDADGAQAGRLFKAFALEALSPAQTAEAVAPHFEADALPELQRLSRGHPAFVQAWAYGAWNHSAGPKISRADLRACQTAVLERLDSNFYGPGFERLSPREKAYLRTMAHLGPGPHRSGDIADSMDAKITSLGPLRAKLIAAGWVYSPQHGLLGFTAPAMDEFIRRVMPGFR